jgi:hypothetical protein
MFYCEICKARQSFECWCDDEDLERAERMINEIADHVAHSSEPREWRLPDDVLDEQNAEFDRERKLSWYDNTDYIELNIADLCKKVCPMLYKFNAYLNELEMQLDAAEASLVYDPEFSNAWWQLLVLRGERVSRCDGTDCEFNHQKSGHGEK